MVITHLSCCDSGWEFTSSWKRTLTGTKSLENESWYFLHCSHDVSITREVTGCLPCISNLKKTHRNLLGCHWMSYIRSHLLTSVCFNHEIYTVYVGRNHSKTPHQKAHKGYCTAACCIFLHRRMSNHSDRNRRQETRPSLLWFHLRFPEWSASSP